MAGWINGWMEIYTGLNMQAPQLSRHKYTDNNREFN